MTQAQTEGRRLYVAWRDPESRRIWPVGVLAEDHRDDGGSRFVFAYLKQAEQLPRFKPFPSFPDLHRRYEGRQLFPLFMNRVMPRKRPDYGHFVARLDLPEQADPFEVLARSGGRKETDRIEVFPAPQRTHDGRLRCAFFVRGIRHLPDADVIAGQLRPGDELRIVAEPTNVVNPRALLLNVSTGKTVGYVPDYLLDTVHELTQLCVDLPNVTVLHVNGTDTPPHLRLLCELRACWPTGYRPFSGPEFQPLADV